MNMKYFFGFLGSLGLVILVFILVLRGLGGGGGGQKPKEEVRLPDYTHTTTAMQFTTEGRVNADQEHYAVRITVSRSEARIEILQGYQENVIYAQSYPSNSEAYATFLRALEKMGYTKGDEESAIEDDRGFCPTGQRYIYTIVNGSSTAQRFWTSSCGGGTFEGQSAKIRALFKAQIPEYTKLTRGITL